MPSTELKFFSQYTGVYRIVSRYWFAYGGWTALITSPYLHISIFITLLLHNFWLNSAWYIVPISALPTILGFSLGGFTIWLAFGDNKFREFLLEKEDDEKYSAYVITSASFAHFVVIQFIALIYALCAQGLSYPVNKESFDGILLNTIGLHENFFYSWKPYASFFGFLLFIYALLTGLAATFQVFRMVTVFEKFNNHPLFKEDKVDNDK